MLSETGRFRRSDRVLCSSEFHCVIRGGIRRVSQHFVVITDSTANRDARVRLGVTVSKRVGNAVIRNRVKRRIREWFRRSRASLPGGVIIVIARPSARDLETRSVFRELDAVTGPFRVGVTC